MTKARQTGFTLIEILVTVAIMAILMTIAANGFNRSNSKQNLKAAADMLASDIQATALSALNSEQYQLQTPGGWGIYMGLTTGSYIVYADFDNDKVYDENEMFKTVTLTKNIVISEICFSACDTVNNSLDFNIVDAVPSYATTLITNITGDLEVTLRDNITNVTMVVSVNPFGGVSVE